MPSRRFRMEFEPLESRSLLSHLGLEAMIDASPKGMGPSPVLVGSIQGMEIPTPHGVTLQGTGAVTPLGDVALTGSWGGGKGALDDKGTLTFSSGQGRLELTLKTHGYFPLRSQNSEEIRVTVQPRSASGSYTAIHVAGTINLVNYIGIEHEGEHVPVPFTAQISLKPAK
jgi:hypothetical protein